MRETTTLYKKVGKRYVKHDDYLEDKGLPEGMYLFYKTNKSGECNAMMNMLSYAKVHNIVNLGKFSDLWVNYGDEMTTKISENIDGHIKEKGSYSINELSIIVCKTLSEL